MKRLILSVVAVAALSLFWGASASAQGFGHGGCYGNAGGLGYSAGYGGYGGGFGGYSAGYGGYGGGYGISAYSGHGGLGSPSWHGTSHYDYHPGSFQRHRFHFDYVPGHYDAHRSGHWHR